MLSQISSNWYVKFQPFLYYAVSAKLYDISSFSSKVNIHNTKNNWKPLDVTHLPEAPVLSLFWTDAVLLFIRSSSSS